MNRDEWLTAWVANPAIEDAEGPETIPRSFVIANKLQLLLGDRHAANLGVDRLASKNKRLLEALADIIPRFEERGVHWVLVKWPKLPYPHGDLDILVQDGLDDAESVLNSLGYQYEPDRDRYRRKYVMEDENFTWEADLHTDAAWVGVPYLDTADIYQSSETRTLGGHQVPVPSPTFDLLIWAAHDMRSNRIPLADVLYSHSLLDAVDHEQLDRTAAYHGWSRQLRAYIDAIVSCYDAVYGDRRRAPDINLPIEFPIGQMFRLKLSKLLEDGRRSGPHAAARDLRAYLLFDVRHAVGGAF